MSTAGAGSAASMVAESVSRSESRKRSCVRKAIIRSKSSPCNRKPLWIISYIGPLCNFHFENYLTSHAVDPADIERLSEEERDFVVRAEPGKGYSGNRK